jgi:hypothetical protein
VIWNDTSSTGLDAGSTWTFGPTDLEDFINGSWEDYSDNGLLPQFSVQVGGAAPVPEPSTYMAGALMLLPFGAGVARKLCKRHTA